MKIRLFLLIFVFTNFCFQLSLLPFPEEVYQKMIKRDYKGMRSAVENMSEEAIIASMPNDHGFYEQEYCKKNSAGFQNLTIFHAAVILRDIKALAILLDKYSKQVDVVAGTIVTPLNLACHSSAPEVLPVVDLLVRAGADVNTKNDVNGSVKKLNALSASCKFRNYPVVEYLLLKGASVKSLSSYAINSMLYHPERVSGIEEIQMQEEIQSRSSLSPIWAELYVKPEVYKVMYNFNEVVLPIVHLLFLHATDKSEVNKLRAAIENAALCESVEDDIDQGNEECIRMVEQLWENRDTEFISTYVYEQLKDGLQANSGYSHIMDTKRDSIFCTKNFSRVMVINPGNFTRFIAILKNRMNKRYSSLKAINSGKYSTPELNRKKVLDQLQIQEGAKCRGGLGKVFKGREEGSGMVRDLTCINPKK